MGLLDDAIREHLDLKRRRGADPAEVARMEQEALGPVRRQPAPAPAEPVADELARAEAEPTPAPDERPVAETAPAPSERDEPEHPHPASDDLHPDEHTHVLAPEDRHEPPHGDPLSQPTTEYRVEDHHDDEDEHGEPEPHAQAQAQPQAADEDVLEETPDFLQETPEHDRLWFEQRPPRDFDFDG